MSRLTDIDNYLVVENGQIKESTFKQDIQIQNQTLTINEDAKVQIIYKVTQEGDYQFDITLKDRLHVDLVEMYEVSTKCHFAKNIKINESCEVLRYVEKNCQENVSIDLDENVDVCANAHISCAYVELTDYSTLSKELDISEEKQRLANHLNYFRETMAEEGGQGKKLGFIAQEMGREINTTGSKSNNAEMQNIVVKMKDELEQIKEQVLNAL